MFLAQTRNDTILLDGAQGSLHRTLEVLSKVIIYFRDSRQQRIVSIQLKQTQHLDEDDKIG